MREWLTPQDCLPRWPAGSLLVLGGGRQSAQCLNMPCCAGREQQQQQQPGGGKHSQSRPRREPASYTSEKHAGVLGHQGKAASFLPKKGSSRARRRWRRLVLWRLCTAQVRGGRPCLCLALPGVRCVVVVVVVWCVVCCGAVAPHCSHIWSGRCLWTHLHVTVHGH